MSEITYNINHIGKNGKVTISYIFKNTLFNRISSYIVFNLYNKYTNRKNIDMEINVNISRF